MSRDPVGQANPPVALAAAALAALATITAYVVLSGTPLVRWVFLWLVSGGLLLTAAGRGPQDRSRYTWVLASLLATALWNVASTFAHQREWPASQLHALSLVSDVTIVLAVACVATALVPRLRPSGAAGRQRFPEPH